MKNYKEPNGCWNCSHICRMGEYDEPSRYFCHIDGSVRPRSGSVAINESFVGSTPKEWERQEDEWAEWGKPRQVEPWGTCDLWEMEHV